MRLEVGRIGRPHGLRGEVHVVPVTNVPDRFARGAQLSIDEQQYEVVDSRPHKGGWLVRFAGIDDREQATRLQGRTVFAEAVADDDDGELWAHEMIGSAVRDASGATVGTVVAIEANPAHDLLVLDDGSLVPVVFVVHQGDGEIVIDPPEGLLEL